MHYWTQSLGSDSAAADQSCEDKDVHCPTSYAQYCEYEVAETREHIQNTCPLTCGLCKAPSPSPAPPSPSPVPGQVCEDKDVHCPTSYAQYCEYEVAETRAHIQNTCPLTCGPCTA